jgi:hypothetical protein
LLVAEILQTDILRRVVISVNVVPAIQALKHVLTVVVWAIILVGEPALRATLTRVRRVNLLHFNPFRLSFVRDVFVESVERPLVNRLRVRETFADTFELLEHDVRAVVFKGLLYEFVRDRVKKLLEAPSLLATDPLNILVCPASADLLQVAPSHLVLSMPVVEFAATPEFAG